MTETYLPHRGILEISGADARDFLQGLITNDVRKAQGDYVSFAALLSPQGKFLCDFFIGADGENLLLETEIAWMPGLVKRFAMYRLRSKVAWRERPDLAVGAAWGGNAAATCKRFIDERIEGLGVRLWGAGGLPVNVQAYDAHRLTLGVPDGMRDLVADRSLILEYGYDELHAVDFAKGCYVGQEVTARSKHRASLRRFIHQVDSGSDSLLPPIGTPVLAGEKSIGEMRSRVGKKGLAHLQVAEVARAVSQGVTLTAGDIRITARLPDWCQTRFADDGK